jgi:hypothetical protein
MEKDVRLESLAAALQVTPPELRKYYDVSRQFWEFR